MVGLMDLRLEGGRVWGFHMSHLLFADDTLVMCEADVNQFQNLRCLLLCFKAVSGLKINLSKSEVITIGRVKNVRELVGILGYGMSSSPMKYLGLPLGATSKTFIFGMGSSSK